MINNLGVSFDGFATTSEVLKTAHHAVAAGVQNLWMAEHLGYREAFVTAMGFRMNDPGAMVVPTAVSPYLWHPTPTAMSLATLAEVGNVPVGIAVATGNPMFLEESGKEIVKPIAAVKEFVEILRQIWNGDPVHYNGKIFMLSGAQLAFKPPQPLIIYVAAIGPQMLRLSGRIADGIVLSAGLSPQYCKRSLDVVSNAAIKSGRNPDKIKKAAYIIFSVSHDGKSAISRARAKLAFLLRNRALEDNIAVTGIPVDQDKIIDAIGRRAMEEAANLVSDDAVEAFTVAGTPKDCRERIEAFFANGVHEPVLMIQGDGLERDSAINFLQELK
mgnify:FL=1|jgi:5,10-methylenetetrahydromethanopterin reductase